MQSQRLSPSSNCSLALPSLSLQSSSLTLIHHRPIKLAFNRNPTQKLCVSLKMEDRSQMLTPRAGGLSYCSDKKEEDDDEIDAMYMRRSVELASTAIGKTSPNPMVGCVIVKDGKIVGEGFHPKAGQPHAEVFALRDAGHLAEGATAYVSLEPCNHYGRTPPCSDALVAAKVKRVVVGMVDPNPIVASKGVDKLRGAGIDVTVGVEEELCKRLNEGYIHQMLSGKPFLALRYSLSLNGSLVDQLGAESSEPGGYHSKLLQEYDAIILSSSAVDHISRIASKEPDAKQPLMIIVADNAKQIPNIPKESASNILIFSQKDMVFKQEIETVVLDKINMNVILEYCKNRGFCSVLMDLYGSFGHLEELMKEAIEQHLLQKIIVEVLPEWNASKTGNSLMTLLMERVEFKNLQCKSSGTSVVLEGYL